MLLCGDVLLPFIQSMVESHHQIATTDSFILLLLLLLLLKLWMLYDICTWHGTQFALKLSIFQARDKSIQFLLIFKICKSQKGYALLFFWLLPLLFFFLLLLLLLLLLVYSLCRSHKIWLKVIYCNFYYSKSYPIQWKPSHLHFFLPLRIVKAFVVLVCNACRNSHKSPKIASKNLITQQCKSGLCARGKA